MLLSAIKENDNNETRVSISPESVKLFSRLGFEVIIENGAGETSGYQNSNYEEAGAKIVTRSECLKADVCLCVRMPSTCLLYTSPSPRDYAASRMPSSA